VVRLLRTPEFKVITAKEREAIQTKVPLEALINHFTKLEVGILALIWCEGSQAEKARFLYSLANSKNNPAISWSDDELKFIFLKILHFSTDLPIRYADNFKQFQQLSQSKDTSRAAEEGEEVASDSDVDDLFSIHQILESEVQGIEDLDQQYQDFYYDWFIDLIFLESASVCTKDEFVAALSNKANFGWLFDSK